MSKTQKIFLGGVVEGFYGRPWTMSQRKELFRREKKLGLNTYLYAPKDDYKHRMYWRDLYSPQEAEDLQELIGAAQGCEVEFIYALSPGLDVTFSNSEDLSALKHKLSQVRGLGCRSFALLFDDIESEMCPADKAAYGSFADAQVSITNQLFEHLMEPQTFLFCPTDYCAAFCTPCVSLSQYLNTVGEKLNPGIDVLWTGPKVVSQEISLASIEEVSAVLRRPPVIWDNIHANDYDPQRFFLGPYKNRPTALIPKLRGVLTNPNCEFELNFVALHTLAQWCRSRADSTGGDDPNSDYNPHDALQLALTDLLVEFGKSEHPSEQRCIRTPAAGENPLFHAEPLQRSDLTLLSELFYLPYEHGDTATRMLRELHWLITHSCSLPQSEEWHRRAKAFDQMCDAVVQMFNRLSNAANRLILYDLYNYICDIKSGVCLARAHVTALGGRDPHPALALTDDPEPWGFRGGLSGEFQRMLPSHGNRDLFRIPPKTRIYSIRAWTTRDQPEVMAIFQQKEMETQPKLQLLGDRLVTLEVSRSQDCSLILDDDSGVCGYGFALSEAETALRSTQYPESLLKEFPSVLALQVHPRVPDHSAAKHLLDQLLSTLRDTGSRGVFSEFRSSDRRMLDFMKTLKGFSVLQIEGIPPELVIIGTKL